MFAKMRIFKNFRIVHVSTVLLFLSLSLAGQVIAKTINFSERSLSSNQWISLTLTVRSINDLRVQEGQKVTIGQLLALKPVEPQAPQRYISKDHNREVEKQKAKLARVKQIVQEEGLPEMLIKHEEAKLKDLEFAADEFTKGAVDPKAPQETTYNSPVNGTIKRITTLGGSDGRLNVEVLIELQS